MGPKWMNILAIVVLSLSASTIVAGQSNVFDVTSSKYGGQPDSDISNSLTKAWTDACSSTSMSTVIVPRGTYKLIQQVSFEGPCKAPIQFQLQGTLQGPKDRRKLGDSWVLFTKINMLTLSGGGTFDGQGALTWKKNDKDDGTPVDIRLNTVNDSTISDITSMNSAKFHIGVQGSNNITFQRLIIIAPEDSPNTDGIHISGSTKITVSDSHIATGDDCVSIGDGSNQILVSNVTCGPGHGISIGSLGKYPGEQPVVDITVKNCTLIGTANGARIKTWPDSPGESIAWNILFQDMIMVNVENPILIDQYYCDKGKVCKPKVPSKVQISDVRFMNIKGSSSSPVAVKIDCSKSAPCRNVELSNIDLTYSGDEKATITSECSNVKPRITDVTKALACANLGDIPINNSPPPIPASPDPIPPLSPPLSPPQSFLPLPFDLSSPPPFSPPLSPPPFLPPLSPQPFIPPPLPPVVITPPLPPVFYTPPLPPVVDTPPLPPVVDTPPLPPVVDTPPLPPVVDIPPLPPVVYTPPTPPPKEASDDPSRPIIMIINGYPYPTTSSAAGIILWQNATGRMMVLTSILAFWLLHILL